MTATEYRTAPAGPGLRARVSRSRIALVAVLAFAVLVAVLAIGARPGDFVPLSTENSSPTGARAVAQILRAHGVEVRQVDRLAQARVADPAATTVVIAEPSLLTDTQVRSLADYPGDLVLLGPSDDAFEALGVPAREAFAAVPQTVTAECADPDAVAAGTVRLEFTGMTAIDGAELCFTGRGDVAAFVRVESDGRSVAAIAASEIVSNGGLDQHGHAALALRTLGRQADVVWYVTDGFDASLLTWTGSGSGGDVEPPSAVEAVPDFLPPGTGTAIYALALAALVAAYWRARRFGPLVAEPLPVVVRASEATRGRARLYRRARATGRAAAGLRAATAMRIGRRIGVGRADGRAALVDGIRRATGRDPASIERLLYGPPPADDAALMTLTSQLDALESEVHRP